MNDRKAKDILRDALLAEKEIPVTDAEAEEALRERNLTPERLKELEEGRVQFARMALKDLHQVAVQSVGVDQTVGEWFRRTREKARLSRNMIAATLSKDISFVEQLESNKILPPQLSAEEALELCKLFRINFDAFVQLFENTIGHRIFNRFSKMLPTVPPPGFSVESHGLELSEEDKAIDAWLIDFHYHLSMDKDAADLID
jgi:transcriptional regulator with XRE-family HTH domain